MNVRSFIVDSWFPEALFISRFFFLFVQIESFLFIFKVPDCFISDLLFGLSNASFIAVTVFFSSKVFI